MVAKRRDPHMCVAEFTSQVECRPRTVRRKIPHKHIRPSADGEENDAEDGDGHPVPLADPDVELVFAEFGDVGQ